MTFMWNVGICVLLLLPLLTPLRGGKVWAPNTNFENPNNWDIGRQPNCEKDTVIFPSASSISVSVGQSIAAKAIILPANGELILPRNGSVVVGDVSSRRSCDGQQIRFTGDSAQHWFDPASWRLERRENEAATPHSERVPCSYDTVIFPPNSTFKVVVEGIEAQVHSFVINQKVLHADNLRLFLESANGRRQFEVKSRLSLSDRVCSDLSGCSCGNERPLPLSHICTHLDNRCPLLRCADPIRPLGFCCDICGAMLSSGIGYRFHWKRFEDFVAAYTEKSVYESVSSYVYKTYTGDVHAVFVDRELPRRSADLVRNMQRELENDAQKSYLDVVSPTARMSVNWFDDPEGLHGQTTGMSGGGVAALIIGLMALLVIALLFYVQRHKLLPLAFSFGRFENEDDSYVGGSGFELAQPAVEATKPPHKPPRTQVAETAPTKQQEAAVGFENPFYSTEGVKEAEAVGDLRENPCYLAFERLEDIPEMSPGLEDVQQQMGRENISSVIQ